MWILIFLLPCCCITVIYSFLEARVTSYSTQLDSAYRKRTAAYGTAVLSHTKSSVYDYSEKDFMDCRLSMILAKLSLVKLRFYYSITLRDVPDRFLKAAIFFYIHATTDHFLDQCMQQQQLHLGVSPPRTLPLLQSSQNSLKDKLGR